MKQTQLFEAIGEVDEELLMEAEKERNKASGKKKKRLGWQIGFAAAAIFAVSIILPNTSANLAYAMSNIPVLGKYFEVVTFRNYQYESYGYNADIEVPQIVVNGPADARKEAAENGENENQDTDIALQTEETVEQINAQIQSLTDELIDEFEEDLKKDYDEDGYYSNLTVAHEVLVDNEKWYTLKLSVTQQAGSSWVQNRFYTIDKRTGKLAAMKEMFAPDSNYKEAISENIKEQMRQQMAEDENVFYWVDYEEVPAWNFGEISDDVSFYVNEQDELVICFNEGDVAPMYMGCVEFTIPREVTAPLFKEE